MGVEVLGESQKLSMSLTEAKKLMGKGYRSSLGCVEFEEPEGHSGGNTQRQLELRREFGVVKGWLITVEADEITCGMALAQGTMG